MAVSLLLSVLRGTRTHSSLPPRLRYAGNSSQSIGRVGMGRNCHVGSKCPWPSGQYGYLPDAETVGFRVGPPCFPPCGARRISQAAGVGATHGFQRLPSAPALGLDSGLPVGNGDASAGSADGNMGPIRWGRTRQMEESSYSPLGGSPGDSARIPPRLYPDHPSRAAFSVVNLDESRI